MCLFSCPLITAPTDTDPLRLCRHICSCRYCGLESLDGLPAGLTYLQVSHNVGLLALPDALPPNLEVLKIEGEQGVYE